MENLVNCDIIIDIYDIVLISGGNRRFEIVFLTKEKERYKIVFDCVWDLRYSIENGYIDRCFNFIRKAERHSDVLIVENSKYIEYFRKQVSETLPADELRNYIVFDKIDTVVEVLANADPILVKL